MNGGLQRILLMKLGAKSREQTLTAHCLYRRDSV